MRLTGLSVLGLRISEPTGCEHKGQTKGSAWLLRLWIVAFKQSSQKRSAEDALSWADMAGPNPQSLLLRQPSDGMGTTQ